MSIQQPILVPYDIALLAKEYGFKETCLKKSEHRKECVNKVDGSCPLHNIHCAYPSCEIDKNVEPVGLPMYLQLVDWFETKGIYITPNCSFTSFPIWWDWTIKINNVSLDIIYAKDDESHNDKYLALEAAFLKAFTILKSI